MVGGQLFVSAGREVVRVRRSLCPLARAMQTDWPDLSSPRGAYAPACGGYSPASLRRSKAHTSSAGYRRCPPGVRTDGIRPRRAQSVTARSDTWKRSATSRVRRRRPRMFSGRTPLPTSSSSSASRSRTRSTRASCGIVVRHAPRRVSVPDRRGPGNGTNGPNTSNLPVKPRKIGSTAQVSEHLRDGVRRQLGPLAVRSVVDGQGNWTAGHRLDLRIAELPADVVDRRRDLLARELRGVALLREGSDRDGAVALAGVQDEGPLDADELGEPLAQLGIRGELEEHGGAQLSGPGDQRVVRVELTLDRLVRDQLLDPRHLLDLEADGVSVLEHEGHDVAEVDASPLL